MWWVWRQEIPQSIVDPLTARRKICWKQSVPLKKKASAIFFEVFCLVFETTIGGFLVHLFVFELSPEKMLKMMFCLLTTLFSVMFIQGPWTLQILSFGREELKKKTSLKFKASRLLCVDPLKGIPSQETNISHLGKRKIIFKYALSGRYVNSLEGRSKF